MPPTQFKALKQLGLRQTGLYALYQLELKSGFLRLKTRPQQKHPQAQLEKFLPLPQPAQLRALLGETGLSTLYHEADEIVAGKVRLFGGEAIPLDLKPPGTLRHWTQYRVTHLQDHRDIKFIWEASRFCWATTLARAYLISQDERYSLAFWNYVDDFLTANTAYLGLNWVSAQEVAIRLTCLVFAYQILAASPHSTLPQVSRLSESIAQHAARIPPSLIYARAQNNNHLLSESMGLITAARALPSHPSADQWHALGWKWYHQGLQTQISADGNYTQHSTNYHRLMLQTALWVNLVAQTLGKPFPEKSTELLAAATRWLLSLLDPLSGCVPNLGPNDGAYIFPLSVLPFQDFRPVIQAAANAFAGAPVLPDGIWDEMSLWLCDKSHVTTPTVNEHRVADKKFPAQKSAEAPPHILKSPCQSWTYLRIAHFTSRPGHADQLHLDLWWRGLNIALDPGTYLYNAPAPWDNSLTSTFVHNTVTVNELEQMRRVSRFLYLDWAQGEVRRYHYDQDGSLCGLTACHDGYRRLGILHQRLVVANPDGWKIEDALIAQKMKSAITPARCRLHWLLPDWDWELDKLEREIELKTHSPFGWIKIQILVECLSKELGLVQPPVVTLVRAGQILAPQGETSVQTHPTWGWVSPTYGVKVPALSLSVKASGGLPLVFITKWQFPSER